jgi:hypothetical protein
MVIESAISILQDSFVLNDDLRELWVLLGAKTIDSGINDSDKRCAISTRAFSSSSSRMLGASS